LLTIYINDCLLIGIETSINGQLERIHGNCERLEILVNKEPPSRRQNARMYDF